MPFKLLSTDAAKSVRLKGPRHDPMFTDKEAVF